MLGDARASANETGAEWRRPGTAPGGAESPCRQRGHAVRRAIIVHSKTDRMRRAMEAEQINLIANTLDSVDDRTAQLRRYL
jgi:hypothetical protein